MPLSRHNYYNPFLGTFLGAFSNNESLSSTDNKIFLNDIDLYYQPVPSPLVAFFFSVVSAIMLIFGVYLHLEVLMGLKREDSILKQITKTFVYANMTLLTTAIICINVVNFIHSLSLEFTDYICPVLRFLLYLGVNFVSFYSFVSASMRYLFIVHTDEVDKYGKERVKTIFYALSILIPLMVTIWKVLDGSEVDAMSFINKCYGQHHKVFLIETSTVNVFKKSFCQVPNYGNQVGYDKLVAFCKQTFCMASTITMLIMGSNITEGLIYYKLFAHMNK